MNVNQNISPEQKAAKIDGLKREIARTQDEDAAVDMLQALRDLDEAEWKKLDDEMNADYAAYLDAQDAKNK